MKTSPEYVQTYQPGPGAADAEEQERDKPLCVRARAELPLLGMKTTEVERRILLAALMEAKGAGRRISYSRNKSHYPGMHRYKGKLYTYGIVGPSIGWWPRDF